MKIEKEIIEINANLDDQSPEQVAPFLEKLLELGALDAWLTPIIMKKGRPALKLTILSEASDLEKVERFIFTHTTALGFRYIPVTRHALERRWEEVSTPYGKVRIKIGLYREEHVGYAPEYEDCLRLAEEKDVPIKDVFAEANRAYLNQFRP